MNNNISSPGFVGKKEFKRSFSFICWVTWGNVIFAQKSEK